MAGYFLRVGNEPPRGPLPLKAIKEAVQSGVVPAGALVSADGQTGWRPVGEVLASAPARSMAWLFYVLAAVVLVGGGGGAFAVWWRTRPPPICPASTKLVATLPQSMQIDAYVTRGTPKLDAFVRDLDRLLGAYRSASKGKLTYRIIEAKDEDTKHEAKEGGLQELALGDPSSASVTMGFMGLVFKYGSEKDAIRVLSPDSTDGLDFWIVNKMREIRAKAENTRFKIGVVGGHKESGLSAPELVAASTGRPSLKSIITQNFAFYDVVDVSLGADVDPSIEGLIVTQPDDDYTQAELERLDAFLMRGKALAVFASAVNVKANDATMIAHLSTHGLERLLEGYGITMHKDVVLDFGSAFEVKVAVTSGLTSKTFPFIPTVKDERLDATSAPLFRLQEVAFPLASSLDLDPKKQPRATARVLARTSDKATRLTDDPANLGPMQAWTPKGPASEAVIAASVEGPLASAFGKGPSSGDARVLVVASSQFLANPFARAGNPPDMGQMGMMMPGMGGDEQLLLIATPYAQNELTSTILVFKNTLDWLSMDDDLAKCALPVPKEKKKK